MHVALVVPGGVDRGGRERVIPALLWLIERLATEHRVTVVALGQEVVACRYELLGATVVNVPPESRGPHRLARIVTRAVHAVGSNGKPDIVHGMWASVSGLSAVLAARRHRVPSLVHVAGGELVAMRDIGYGGALGRGGRAIARATLRLATEATVASQFMADRLAAVGHHADAIIPLGADTSRFTPAAARREAHRLVQVASLNRVKDQATLLRALARVQRDLPDVELDIIGVDTLGGEVQWLAAQLAVPGSVRFHGFVPSEELAPYYQAASVNVITSRHEAGPVAVAEAAACATPTVGTAVGHIDDLARRDAPAAVAVPVGDHEALASALIEMLTNDKHRGDVAERALTWARTNDADATASAFMARYHSLGAR